MASCPRLFHPFLISMLLLLFYIQFSHRIFSFEGGLAQNHFRRLFLPRDCTRTQEIWSARLEHSLRIQRQRSRLLLVKFTNVLPNWNYTLGRAHLYHRRNNLRGKNNRRLGPEMRQNDPGQFLLARHSPPEYVPRHSQHDF